MRTRVAVIGRSVHMAGLAASLKATQAMQVIRINPDLPTTRQDIDGLGPDVVIFDLVEPIPDLTISLLRERPGLLLLGMDPSRDEMLVLAGRSERALSVQDLLQVVNRKEVTQSEGPKEEVQSRGKPNIVYNQFQSNQTQLIEKEIKMKNLAKRNKIVLAIVGVLVIAVVAVVIFFQASGEVLFGTLTPFTITPSSSTIIVGQSETLSSNASWSNCSWISSNTSVVSITSSSTKSATVLAKGTGTATITEKCGLLASNSATVTVKLLTIAPANPTITIGQTVTLTVASNPAPRCEWQYPSSPEVRLSSRTPTSAVLTGLAAGTSTVTAVCDTGAVSTTVTVIPQQLSISPANPTITIGQTVTLTVAGNPAPRCEWQYPSSPEVRLSSRTPTSAVLTGVAAGTSTITAVCDTGAVSTTVTVK